MAGFTVSVGKGSLAYIRPGGDAKRLFDVHIYKGGGDLPVVFNPQGAMPDRAACGGFNAVGETAVGF